MNPPAAVQESRDALRGAAGVAFRALFFVFIAATLFDPADKVLGMKVPLFLACWVGAGWFWLADRSRRQVPTGLFTFVLLMVLIPVGSIWYYFLVDGGQPYAGLSLLKAYLFVSVAILVYITRVDAIKYLAAALTILAIAVLVLTAIVQVFPALFLPAYYLGDEYGIFSIDAGRDYGTGTRFFQMYFVTSPMLVVSIAYYFEQLRSAQRRRVLHAFLLALSVCAMFAAGSRSNLVVAAFLPIALFLYYSRYRLGIAIIAVSCFSALLYTWRVEIGAMLDPGEVSNFTKLTALKDYADIFSADPVTLFFGRGLGSYEQWTARTYYFVTELTFLELIRNFGVLMGGVMTLLLLYPVIYAYVLRPTYPDKPMIIAYAAFLLMSMTNPLFFSSMGMLILASLLARIALFERRLRHPEPQLAIVSARGVGAAQLPALPQPRLH